MNPIDVAIVGAGPNGLALALELAGSGLVVKIFGHPMAFWSKIAGAAEGRYLKSFGSGANIDCRKETSFTDWSRARGLETFEPCSIASFASYGLWLQETLVPNVIRSSVAHLSLHANGFFVGLDNGDEYCARRVVIATGLSGFQHIPPVLRHLPASVCSHSNDISDFARFQGQKVAVVGAGQSALEAATLLSENGAVVELVAREHELKWMTRLPTYRSVFRRVRRPISSLGVGLKSWILVHLPRIFFYLPKKAKTKFFGDHLPPEGAWWLRERCEKATKVTLGALVGNARTRDGKADLYIQKNGDAAVWRRFDFIVAATGFQIDVARIGFIDRKLRSLISCTAASPKLDRAFQSSVPGLYFVGPAAAASHGPLVRFVAGVTYAAPVVASHIRTSSLRPSDKLQNLMQSCWTAVRSQLASDRYKVIGRKSML